MTNFRKILFTSFVTVLALVSTPAHAIITITITEGGEGGTPIAISPFKWQGSGSVPTDVSGIVTADLRRSGRFAPLTREQMPAEPFKDKDVVFKDWRLVKATALVIGHVTPVKPDQYRVEFRLYDVFRERQLAGYRYTVKADRLRSVAHQISDLVYEKLTGEKGVFGSRIAYVSQERGKDGKRLYRLSIADSDGVNPQTILSSAEPLMSPAWSPDGKQLAYVSFEQKRSMVYLQDLKQGKRVRVAAFRGINSAPAWSPDGARMAVTLSKDGNPEIYIIDIAKKSLQRLTFNRAIDTEPAWSPDGRDLVFTSDRAGGPQIYRKPVAGGQAERLSFEGNYNARPSYSPDGQQITMITRRNGKYNVGVISLADKSMQVLTDTRLDESPSFAPNGQMLLYATERQGRGVLASVSADGRVRHLFTLTEGDIREPAWSPYNP
ncbi:MAG: Tol-Pal system beta propeller repeat protein TolB [Acidiferrobacterales bacterium]|jgi:TolB protein|nr:Tol-Pal system beta propeller repeat protein TolB [Acidiferrobacterales bacterium]